MIIVILNRLKQWYDIQLLDSFRSGRGTADGIYITKRVQQISDSMKKPVFVLFIDLSAAFDHVVRKWMFKSVHLWLPVDSNKILITLLEAVYEYTTTALSENPDEIFTLSSGVRQCGPESPPLYNLFMDFVMRVFLNECSLQNIDFVWF